MEISNSEDDFAQCSSERKLFSLYLMYPDVEAYLQEPQAAPNSPKQQLTQITHSSPMSTISDPSATDSPQSSDSTAHTTPLRPLPSSRPPTEFIKFADFQANLARSALPQESIAYFHWFGQTICEIGALLFAPEWQPVSIEHNDQALRLCSMVLKAIHYSTEQVNGKILRLAYLKTLAAFNCQPEERHLWSTYRQRAKLIIRYGLWQTLSEMPSSSVISNSALPCRTEADQLEQLAHLYDAYVYHPALCLRESAQLDQSLVASLHDIYHSIMTWLLNYKRWCRAMKEMRRSYLLPLMQSMVASRMVMNEIKETRQNKDKATRAILATRTSSSAKQG